MPLLFAPVPSTKSPPVFSSPPTATLARRVHHETEKGVRMDEESSNGLRSTSPDFSRLSRFLAVFFNVLGSHLNRSRLQRSSPNQSTSAPVAGFVVSLTTSPPLDSRKSVAVLELHRLCRTTPSHRASHHPAATADAPDTRIPISIPAGKQKTDAKSRRTTRRNRREIEGLELEREGLLTVGVRAIEKTT